MDCYILKSQQQTAMIENREREQAHFFNIIKLQNFRSICSIWNLKRNKFDISATLSWHGICDRSAELAVILPRLTTRILQSGSMK